MKKILIVIHDMRIGGAQKSLLSFLECLEGHEKRQDYEIHLLPLRPEGEFLNQLPASVHVVTPENALCWMSMPLNGKLLTKRFSLRGILGEGLWLIRKALRCLPRSFNETQRLWRNWQPIIPAHRGTYDVAVAYMDGVSSYYVMDKVRAGKKVLWLHNDYEKVQYAPAFDAPYYAAADQIITISDECLDAVRRHHPQAADKMAVLPNITAYHMLKACSESGDCPEYDGCTGLKLLTVGRLHTQKGIDLAIRAAEILRQESVDFTWLVVGEGGERENLERQLRATDLENHFQLIGARMNPYAYMRESDIMVQSSRYEGKSIVLDEAKMLCKPIVATNYSTVNDAVTHGETGFIVDMTPEGIAGGVRLLQQDEVLRSRLAETLAALPKGNTEALQQYMNLMF